MAVIMTYFHFSVYLHGSLSEAVIEQLHVALLLLQLLLQLGDTSLQPPLLFQQRRPDAQICITVHILTSIC